MGLLLAAVRILDSVQHTGTDFAILICDAYISLFDDMTIHKDVWLEKLLHPTGSPMVEHATGNFLSHMARAHKIRNEHARCKAVLKLEAITLTCLEKQIQHAFGPSKGVLEGNYRPFLEQHHWIQ